MNEQQLHQILTIQQAIAAAATAAINSLLNPQQAVGLAAAANALQQHQHQDLDNVKGNQNDLHSPQDHSLLNNNNNNNHLQDSQSNNHNNLSLNNNSNNSDSSQQALSQLLNLQNLQNSLTNSTNNNNNSNNNNNNNNNNSSLNHNHNLNTNSDTSRQSPATSSPPPQSLGILPGNPLEFGNVRIQDLLLQLQQQASLQQQQQQQQQQQVVGSGQNSQTGALNLNLNTVASSTQQQASPLLGGSLGSPVRSPISRLNNHNHLHHNHNSSSSQQQQQQQQQQVAPIGSAQLAQQNAQAAAAAAAAAAVLAGEHPHSHRALTHPVASLLINTPHYQTVRTKYSTRRYSRRRVGPEEAMADPAIRATVQLKMPVVQKTILIVLKHRLTVQTAITLACAQTGERLRKGAIQKKLEAMFREPGAVDSFLNEWDHPR